MSVAKSNVVKNSKIVKEPLYLKELYGFLYHNPKLEKFMDDDRIQALLSFGFKGKLIDDMLEDVGTNSSVLQIGCTFGSQMQKTADKIGRYGSYVIVDVSNEQLERARGQLIDKKIDFERHDARKPFNGKYDTVICFMLLHELPETSREKVINNALAAVKNGGRAIFIDYHQPSDFNVLRFILKPFNRLFFPFVEKLWKNPIKNYARKSNHFSWYKKSYGAQMFQKVTAVRRVSDGKKPETKPSFY
ncbi:MAG: rhodoquinone biosynthesis methyltransferase RquA [Alphaproteobacteria bacterium]|nr:rhodoquinone biosynthesis methyltransferase RquA [Alphaproteobacteria bacterium]